MPFKKGDLLQQKVQVVSGPVVGVKYDEDSGLFQYLIAFKDEDGTETQRWFDEHHVEAAPKAEEAAQ
jgi:predicted transcriptional regulator YdeE